MLKHYDGDGCTGQPVQLQQDDCEEIGKRMGVMLMGVASRRYSATLSAGAWIGTHYGYTGEWHLAVRLATQITRLAPAAHRNAFGHPNIAKVLSPEDEHVLDLAHHCAAMFPETRQHTTEGVAHAASTVMPEVEAMIHSFQAERREDFQSGWEHIYRCADGEGGHTQADTLRAAAGSAMLLHWAAQYSTMRV